MTDANIAIVPLAFACAHCTWRGPSIVALLGHACQPQGVVSVADAPAVAEPVAVAVLPAVPDAPPPAPVGMPVAPPPIAAPAKPPARKSPAKRTRRESLFAQKPPAAAQDDFEPETLPASGNAPTGATAATPNPSHPVRNSVRPAQWQAAGPKRAAAHRYCVCGVMLPSRVPERCDNCGRVTK